MIRYAAYYPAFVAGLMMILAAASSVAGTHHAVTQHVKVENVAFSPAKIIAHVGDTIEWENADIVQHSSTVDGKWDISLPVGKTGSVVLKEKGHISYYCKVHPTMKGEIDVLP